MFYNVFIAPLCPLSLPGKGTEPRFNARWPLEERLRCFPFLFDFNIFKIAGNVKLQGTLVHQIASPPNSTHPPSPPLSKLRPPIFGRG